MFIKKNIFIPISFQIMFIVKKSIVTYSQNYPPLSKSYTLTKVATKITQIGRTNAYNAYNNNKLYRK